MQHALSIVAPRRDARGPRVGAASIASAVARSAEENTSMYRDTFTDGSRLGPEVVQRADSRAAEQLPLCALLKEDFVTHGSTLSSPGFWALLAHRLGARIDASAPPRLRSPLGMLDEALASAVDRLWNMRIPRTTRVGRRVQLQGRGAMFLHARIIGDDVCIRSGTTLGPLCTSQQSDDLPVIESGVQLGSHTRVMGAVTIGRGARIGDDATVLDSVTAGAAVRARHR